MIRLAFLFLFGFFLCGADSEPSMNTVITNSAATKKVDVVTDVLGTQRLATDASVTIAPQPLVDTYHQKFDLAISGNVECDVNASAGSPQNCRWTVPAGQTWYVQSLIMVMVDVGTFDENEFGALGALNNGCLVQINTKGTLVTLGNMRDNIDAFLMFAENTNNASDILGDSTFKGVFHFDPPVKVQASTNDFVQVVIRDNVTGLNRLRFKVKAWRVLP